MGRIEQALSACKSLRGAWVLVAACLVFHLAGLSSSCSSIECPVENQVLATYVLLECDGSDAVMDDDTLSILIRVTRSDGQRDSTVLNQVTGSVSSFVLPVSYTQPEDVLFAELRCDDGSVYTDTIRVKKENIPHFESVDCQAAYFHKLTAVSATHHFIDSIVIINPDVTYDPTIEHVCLYLSPDR